jgi:hypothetical protein
MADLARVVVTESVFRRSALEKVLDYHLARGGAPTNTDITLVIKKALMILVRWGLLESAGPYGWWRWREGLDVPADLHLVSDCRTFPAASAWEAELGNERVTEGEGCGCVYVYYFPSYRELAGRKKEVRWPVKVGMSSSSNSRIRIANQNGTAMPEAPVVAYARRTDAPRKLEQTLHAILECRGLKLAKAPGAEWFLSSPEEIKAIVDWVLAPGAQRETATKAPVLMANLRESVAGAMRGTHDCFPE